MRYDVCMSRTTLQLRDDLVMKVRELATREKRTLTQQYEILIEAGLRDVSQPSKEPYRFEWHTNSGGLRPGVDLSDMHAVRELMDEYDGRNRF